MAEYRQSIQDIEKVFETGGSLPALVTCDDLEDWVCKYDRNSVAMLVNEWIASRFLRIWAVPTPAISLVSVSEDHVPAELCPPLQPVYFKKHCFGSGYLPYAKEIDQFFTTFKNDRYQLNKISNKQDFLKIGLFDIWLSNEDRNHNNFNLLLNPEEQGYRFYAIDHGACFNSSSLNYGIYGINEDESILTTEAANVLFSRGQGLNSVVKALVEDFYICAEQCDVNLPDILDELPDSWAVNVEELQDQLSRIFEDEWLNQTEQLFRQFVQLGIR